MSIEKGVKRGRPSRTHTSTNQGATVAYPETNTVIPRQATPTKPTDLVTAAPTLVIVHPGYAQAIHWTTDNHTIAYGNYSDYIGRVCAAVPSYHTILFLHSKNMPAWPLPSQVEVIRNTWSRSGPGLKPRSVKELISKLKSRNITDVNIGGEFLWWYGRNIGRSLQEYYKKLGPERAGPLRELLENNIVLDYKKSLEEIGHNFEEFCAAVEKKRLNPGCAHSLYWSLATEFRTRLVKELCCPSIRPNMSELLRLGDEISTVELEYAQ